MTNILIGKVLRHMEEDSYCVSRITEDLGNSIMLAVRLCPVHGEELHVQHVIKLADLTEDDEIYDDFATMENYYGDKEEDITPLEDHHTIQ